jgi:hypothetical protein
MLLVSIKAEAALVQVLYLPRGFPPATRSTLLAQDNALDRWRETVDACFRLHFRVRPGIPLERGLDHDVLARRDLMHDLIESELGLLISIRNKLAHGQFLRPLNVTLDRVEPEVMKKMERENALTLKFRDNLIEELTKALKDLVQSPATFTRLFNKRYVTIRENRDALARADYSQWVKDLSSSRRAFPDLAKEYMEQHRAI